MQRRYPSRLGELPDGVVVQLDSGRGVARLRWHDWLHRRTRAGYEDPRPVNVAANVTVLTPAFTVAAISAG